MSWYKKSLFVGLTAGSPTSLRRALATDTIATNALQMPTAAPQLPPTPTSATVTPTPGAQIHKPPPMPVSNPNPMLTIALENQEGGGG